MGDPPGEINTVHHALERLNSILAKPAGFVYLSTYFDGNT